jgi:hypothetical protein
MPLLKKPCGVHGFFGLGVAASEAVAERRNKPDIA